jgi:4-hydroxybenzoate polyprenyltransferase
MIDYQTRLSAYNYVKSLRVIHWTKNFLLFVPVVLAHQIHNSELWIKSFAAFISFSLMASALYIINDVVDFDHDQLHRFKKFRPITSGQFAISDALAFSAVLLVCSALVALFLGAFFSAILALYMMLALSYTFLFKKYVVVDVLILSVFYCLRIAAGHAATGLEYSPWLLGFAFLNFAGLALLKRFVEISDKNVNRKYLPGRGYEITHRNSVRVAGILSGISALALFFLYLNSAHVLKLYSSPALLSLIPLALLLWKLRIWSKAQRKEVNEDPILFSVSDPFSYLILFFSLFVMWQAI